MMDGERLQIDETDRKHDFSTSARVEDLSLPAVRCCPSPSTAMPSAYDFDTFDDYGDGDDGLGDVDDYRWDAKGKRLRKPVKKRRRDDDRPEVNATQPRARARRATTPSLPDATADGAPGASGVPGGGSGSGGSLDPTAPGAPGGPGSEAPEHPATLSYASFENFAADREAPIYGTQPEDEVNGFMYELPGARVRGPVRGQGALHFCIRLTVCRAVQNM